MVRALRCPHLSAVPPTPTDPLLGPGRPLPSLLSAESRIKPSTPTPKARGKVPLNTHFLAPQTAGCTIFYSD